MKCLVLYFTLNTHLILKASFNPSSSLFSMIFRSTPNSGSKSESLFSITFSIFGELDTVLVLTSLKYKVFNASQVAYRRVASRN